MEKSTWEHRRARLAEIVEIGGARDSVSRGYDILSSVILLVNLTATVLLTFASVSLHYGKALLLLEAVTVTFFAADYVLRLWTAPYSRPAASHSKAVLAYVFSFAGLIDLFSFLPYYLPAIFPTGAAVLRIFRVIRVFRLFRINAYYDSLNVITAVLSSKRQQLISSVFMMLVLMLASSLCMYSLEHEAQPEVFTNAFSGMWWAVSTVFTIGYGDIYPVTAMGKALSICIIFLGVGMVAIPTGIISAGFVEQYTRLKRMGEYAREADVNFIKVSLQKRDAWVGKTIAELGLPHGTLVAAVRRGREVLVPRGDLTLQDNDTVILGASALKDDKHTELKELVLYKNHPWSGREIRELDISRQTMIVLVNRRGTMRIPKEDLTLLEGDHVMLYSQSQVSGADNKLI